MKIGIFVWILVEFALIIIFSRFLKKNQEKNSKSTTFLYLFASPSLVSCNSFLSKQSRVVHVSNSSLQRFSCSSIPHLNWCRLAQKSTPLRSQNRFPLKSRFCSFCRAWTLKRNLNPHVSQPEFSNCTYMYTVSISKSSKTAFGRVAHIQFLWFA